MAHPQHDEEEDQSQGKRQCDDEDSFSVKDIVSVMSFLSQTTTLPFEFYIFLQGTMNAFHEELEKCTKETMSVRFKSARAKRFLSRFREVDDWVTLRRQVKDIKDLSIHKGFGQKELKRFSSIIDAVLENVFRNIGERLGEALFALEKYTSTLPTLLALDAALSHSLLTISPC